MLPQHIQNPDPSIYLNSDNYIVLDFETTNIDKGDPYNEDNHIVLAVWYSGKEQKLNIQWGNEYGLSRLVDACEQADFLVCHNTKFELGWLLRSGIKLEKVLPYCTMLGHWVYLGNRKQAKDLNTVATHHGVRNKADLVSKMIKGGVCPSEIPKKWLEKYCVEDVLITKEVFEKQTVELEELGLLHLAYTRNIFTPVLVDMERVGMHLDPERVEETLKEYYAKYEPINRELDEISGGINRGSTKQLAEFLYNKLGFNQPRDFRGNPITTKGGKPSTSADTIRKLKAGNKRQRRFLELYLEEAKIGDAISKYLEKFSTCTREDGGILRGSLNQGIAGTHRLTSTGKKYKTQLQNLDRGFKPLFCPREEGWLIGEVDGSQLEFRTAAHLGRDSRAVSDIRGGVDVHAFTSETLTQAGEPTDRQDAKAHTFKPLYGGTSGTRAQQTYYSAFRDKYTGVTETQHGWIEQVLRDKKLRTEYGLIFYWPDTKMQQSGYVTNTTSICNYPVQGFATGEIIPIAVTHQWHRMKEAEMQSFLINTIHDSSIGEVHPDEIELFRDIGVKAYTEDVYRFLEGVYDIRLVAPLGLEAVFTPHWADYNELKQGLGTEEKIESNPIGDIKDEHSNSRCG